MKVNSRGSRDDEIPGKWGKVCPKEDGEGSPWRWAAQDMKVAGRSCGPRDVVSPGGLQ